MFNSWVDLETICPIDISRIKRYSQSFDTNLSVKIDKENINLAKERLLTARGYLDSMITALIQLLYDRKILKTSTDKILFAWLVDNFGRYLKRLDEQEDHLVVRYDEPREEESRVGISRLSTYARLLKTASDSIIYESILKATEEYKNFKETKKIKREPRTFLYILFQVLQVTLAVLGGLTREERTMMAKRGIVHTIPTSWQSLMGQGGQQQIKKGYQEETGQELKDLDEDLEILREDEDLEDESD